MFSIEEKQHLAKVIEEELLKLDHPEMPKEKPNFLLHVDGADTMSWADIKPNWTFSHNHIKPASTNWNENLRQWILLVKGVVDAAEEHRRERAHGKTANLEWADKQLDNALDHLNKFQRMVS